MEKFVPATALISLLTAHYSYDGLGRRTAKTVGGVTTSFVYDGAHVFEERASAGSVRRNIHTRVVDEVLGASETSGTTYYHGDALGSVRVVTGASGSSVGKDRYESFGNVVSTTLAGGGRYGFIGREYDEELGYQFLRQRHMDPRGGRFISRDRFSQLVMLNYSKAPSKHRFQRLRGRLLFLGLSHSSYDYAFNNPVLVSDNNGEFGWTAAAGATMVAGAAAAVAMTAAVNNCVNSKLPAPGTPANRMICEATGVTPEEAQEAARAQVFAECSGKFGGAMVELASFMYDAVGSAVTTIAGEVGSALSGVTP